MSDKAISEGTPVLSSTNESSVPANVTDSVIEPSANTNGDNSEVKASDLTSKVATGDAPREDSTKDAQSIAETTSKTALAEENETSETLEDGAPSSAVVDGTPSSASKSKGRRKSTGVPEHRAKKLNKKASKAKMVHPTATPGDYFMIKLKGYPLWPAIVCDETMLPITLIKSRPSSALKADGTWGAGYEEGGSKFNDRTFSVMYLHTNEFGWVSNHDLVDLDLDTVATDVAPSARKDLVAAHQLAGEKHDLEYFKGILKEFMEARQADQEAKEAVKIAAAEAKAAAAEKAEEKKATKTKRKSKVVVEEDEDDSEMVDVTDGGDLETPTAGKTKSKKRKADQDTITPERSDSTKKAKTTIKLTTTPQLNGSSTKAAKDGSAKITKKSKKASLKSDTLEESAPKEPELTAEEKRFKKEKEILFLRHKLQKGLLTRDQEPKEEEMEQMSEFISKLEGYADLEVSIIRATKINKVLKTILKLPSIPKEEVYSFKVRSQALLDTWNKILANEQPAAVPTATENGNSTEAGEAKPNRIVIENGTKVASGDEKVTETMAIETPASENEKLFASEVANEVPAEETENAIAEPASVETAA